MTSIRQALRWLVGRGGEGEAVSARYSYTVHWTKVAREWGTEKSEEARLAVLELTKRPDFEPTVLDRRYVVPAVDGQAHAGASLIALLDVLEAIRRSQQDTAREKP